MITNTHVYKKHEIHILNNMKILFFKNIETWNMKSENS